MVFFCSSVFKVIHFFILIFFNSDLSIVNSSFTKSSWINQFECVTRFLLDPDPDGNWYQEGPQKLYFKMES